MEALDYRKFNINFIKASTKCCISLRYNVDNSDLLVNGKGIFRFKTDNKNINFPNKFCLGSTFNGFSATESREVSLNRNVYDFSVSYNSIDKSKILKIHKYLMAMNNIRLCSTLLNRSLLCYYWHLVYR